MSSSIFGCREMIARWVFAPSERHLTILLNYNGWYKTALSPWESKLTQTLDPAILVRSHFPSGWLCE